MSKKNFVIRPGALFGDVWASHRDGNVGLIILVLSIDDESSSLGKTKITELVIDPKRNKTTIHTIEVTNSSILEAYKGYDQIY